MKKQTRRVINSILILILLFGLTKFFLSEQDNYRSRQDYDQAMQIAGNPVEEPLPVTVLDTSEEVGSVVFPDDTENNNTQTPEDPVIRELLEIDLNALREENEDVIGWICIPDTNVNYPLLQWTDNEFYLNHTWKQSTNASGAIFMECQNKPDFSEFNTIIYGHNMRNGDMFGSLHHYRSAKYQRSHPYVYIVNDEGVLRFDIFAAQSASTKSIIFGLGIETDQRKEEFIRFAQDYSFFETDLTPTVDDRILTLSTCTGAGHLNRWVVLSILNEEQSYKRPAESP